MNSEDVTSSVSDERSQSFLARSEEGGKIPTSDEGLRGH